LIQNLTENITRV